MPQNVDYSETLHTAAHRFEVAPLVPNGSWGDAQIGASSPILATKLKHQYAPAYAQPHGTAAATARAVVHVARSAGDVSAIDCGIVVAAVGAATVTVDLRKNGSSVLTSVVTINNTHTAYTKVTGAINTAPYVAGDVFEVVVTATAGGGTLPQGLFVSAVFREGSG